MSYKTTADFAVDMCRAFGLEAKHVTELDISIRPGSLVTATARIFLQGEAAFQQRRYQFEVVSVECGPVEAIDLQIGRLDRAIRRLRAVRL